MSRAFYYSLVLGAWCGIVKKKLPNTRAVAIMANDVRWRVSFAADLMTATLTFSDGVLLLRHEALRLVLLDARGVTIDARFLRAGENIDIGDVVSLPCHFAKVRDRLPPANPASTPADVLLDTRRVNAVRGQGAVRHAADSDSAAAGPSSPTYPSMADVRHVGVHPILHSQQQARHGGLKSTPRPVLDLETSFSHFWTAAKKT